MRSSLKASTGIEMQIVRAEGRAWSAEICSSSGRGDSETGLQVKSYLLCARLCATSILSATQVQGARAPGPLIGWCTPPDDPGFVRSWRVGACHLGMCSHRFRPRAHFSHPLHTVPHSVFEMAWLNGTTAVLLPCTSPTNSLSSLVPAHTLRPHCRTRTSWARFSVLGSQHKNTRSHHTSACKSERMNTYSAHPNNPTKPILIAPYALYPLEARAEWRRKFRNK
jgi:hypothetical protein